MHARRMPAALGLVAAVFTLLTVTQPATADPCGMVPPVYVGNDVPISRVGDQTTYVFFKDGTETIVLRPGFEGKVDEFGMLIPFPSVPAIRKVSDHIFPHIAAAIDPPEVVIDVRIFPRRRLARQFNAARPAAAPGGLAIAKNEVRVLKEEAVGMYEVAVLEAGSAQALKRWMDDHGYVYPEGMDGACEDYVDIGWCFVAVKTKVGQKKGVDPQPGQRNVNPKLPAGASFDGHVQAMGFRFEVDELVVPMRLSTFNEGDLHNIVYVLSDSPLKIKSIPEEYVVRQLPGSQLFKNVTDPLPLRIIGGTVKDIQDFQKKNLPQQRDPVPHNGAARDVFAGDLLAVKEDRLTHPHEETEKMLLNIGERLQLRGPEIDKLNEESLKEQREAAVKTALADLDGMTMSVIDGNFPREILANQNLKFAEYKMPTRRNGADFYDAKTKKPAAEQQGVMHYGTISFVEPDAKTRGWNYAGLIAALSCACFGIAFVVRRRGWNRWLAILLTVGAMGIVVGVTGDVWAEEDAEQEEQKELTNLQLIDQMSDPKKAPAAADALIARGKAALPDLLGEAFEGNDMVLRGWAIVCLTEIGGKEAEGRLIELHNDEKQPMLARTWAAAGRVQMAKSTDDVLRLASLVPQFPALGRPVGMRLVEGLSSETGKVSAEDVLNVTIQVPQLQQSLAPAILALGVDTLVDAMATAKNQNVRRQAAAYLGTLAGQGEDAVPSAVVEAYKFDPKAKQVPWNGGPLFVPGLQWSKEDARGLVGNLIAWHLWCDLNNQKAQQQPIHNNLRSIQLAAAAGYQTPGFQEVGTDQWLLAWGRAVGKDELAKLLAAQKVEDEPRFKRILGQVE